jgi:hypothetical protein
MMKDEIKARLEQFDDEVNRQLRNEGFECQHEYENAFYIDDDEGDMEPEEPNPMPNMDDFTPEAYDKYVGAQMMIPTADGRIQGTTTNLAKGEDGNSIGRPNANPFLDTRKYEVQLSDGTTDEFYANIIAENLFSQVDSEGRQYV